MSSILHRLWYWLTVQPERVVPMVTSSGNAVEYLRARFEAEELDVSIEMWVHDDLLLLVRPKDVERVKAILSTAGVVYER